MGKFRFEDYRQPWETGPHWELKREFMEKYCDMFSEDRLLCLAQAYFNIVMMNCRYPDDVMRQISHLSKPLQMCKKFQEDSNDTDKVPQKHEEKREKRKSESEIPAVPYKNIKFCRSEEQLESTVYPQSSVLSKNSSQKVTNINFALSQNQVLSESQSRPASDVTNSDKSHIVKNSHAEQEEIKKINKIVDTLGLEFIQKFVQEIRKIQIKLLSPYISIVHAAQSLKISKMINFKVDLQRNSPCHAQVFESQFSINNCVISCEKAGSKKKAKFQSAETAVNVLMSVVSHMSSFPKTNSDKDNLLETVVKVDQGTNSASATTSYDSSVKSSSSYNSEKSINTDGFHSHIKGTELSNIDTMNILQYIADKFASREKQRHALVTLNDIARKLNVLNYISYDITASQNSKFIQEFECKFFIKKILISCEKGVTKKDAKLAAIKSGFNKISNLSCYEIRDGELKTQQNSFSTESSNLMPNLSHEFIIDVKPQFVLNELMFDSSMKDGFVLVDNFSVQPLSQRNLKCLLSDSASFCHKSFEYEFEDVPEDNQVSRRANVLLDKVIVGTGTSFTKESAKQIACENAVEMLKKKYYILKVKNEYIEGYIISRSQVFDGESFSSAALTDSNIGCRMLKNMGWTGGGLGTSGIAEPVEAHGQNFKQGLGYNKGKCTSDPKTFRNRIEAMLLDYSKSNSVSDLIFSKDFSKDERKQIHRMAQKYKLHTASRGKDNDRFLTVRRKCCIIDILTYLRSNGGSNSKYELIDASTEKYFETTGIKI